MISEYKIKLDNKMRRPEMVLERSFDYRDNGNLDSPSKIVDMVRETCDLQNLAEEHLYMISFDCRLKATGIFLVSIGTSHISLAGVREIFIRALLAGAEAIAIVHNHPTGEPTPSKTDLETAKRISNAGAILGIPLLDSMIVGADSYVSFLSSYPDYLKTENEYHLALGVCEGCKYYDACGDPERTMPCKGKEMRKC